MHHAATLEFDVPSYRTADAKKRGAAKPADDNNANDNYPAAQRNLSTI